MSEYYSVFPYSVFKFLILNILVCYFYNIIQLWKNGKNTNLQVLFINHIYAAIMVIPFPLASDLSMAIQICIVGFSYISSTVYSYSEAT